MRRDVFLVPLELTPTALDGRVVTRIDVLRATTTIATGRHAAPRTEHRDRAIVALALRGTGA